MRQAEFFHNKFEHRRQYEWKITLGVWALPVAGIAFVKQPSSVPYWLAVLFFLAYVFLFVKRIEEANEFDKGKSHFYQVQADTILSDPSHVPVRPPWYPDKKWHDLTFVLDWGARFHIAAILALCLLFYLVKR
jgi:hypothetical protein